MNRFQLQIQMSYDEEDLGQFNESAVFLHPIRFNTTTVQATNKYSNLQSTNLGIYDSIKLTSLLTNRSGEIIEFITLDQRSHNTFVTNEAMSLLEKYSTDDVAFVMVVGNKTAGKSFFCDKILNLSETRGNHFCRKNGKGIHLWTNPFQKDDLKIFLLEISNCQIDSEQFKILSTYSLLISSAFVVVQDFKNDTKSAIEELDNMICRVIEQITPSRIQQQQQQFLNHSSFMPRIFYNLSRKQNTKPNENLRMIKYYANEYLPNAIAKSYNGRTQDLIHVPFLDTKCINELYIRRVASIFRDIFGKIQQKRYNQLVLNGNLIGKIIKYIESYTNKRHEFNIESVYEQIVDDLYQSAYNYCILTYHDEMQKEFQDEQPKSYDELLNIFEVVSDNVLKKFEGFNLDKTIHAQYEEKLQKHISEKQKMLLEINAKKTEVIINESYDYKQIGNIQYYRNFTNRINRDFSHLTHSRGQILGKINTQFYIRTKGSNNIDYKFMKQIQSLQKNISSHKNILQDLTASNSQTLKKRFTLEKSQQEYGSKEQALQGSIRQLKNQIAQVKSANNSDYSKQAEEQKNLNNAIAANQKTINDLKENKGKDPRITNIQNKLQQLKRKIIMQQTLLRELGQSNPVGENEKKAASDKKLNEASKLKNSKP